jgi:hypothetical protein
LNPNGSATYVEMLSLCPYLSKIDGDPEDKGHGDDVGVPSYFDMEFCQPADWDAEGYLAKSVNDYSDTWIVDLKVPPIAGYVGQDWPADCPVLEQDPKGEDYGCDLWIEVTEISES